MAAKKTPLKIPRSSGSIDRLIHEPARFLIMSHLYVVESVDYLFLLNQIDLTQGNLSSHLGKLESAGYVKIKKEFVNKKPHTMLSISAKGRKAFKQYRDDMARMMKRLAD